MNDRLLKLEERLAELQDMIDTLNEVVTKQADQIDFLRQAHLERGGDEQPIGPALDPPPHY